MQMVLIYGKESARNVKAVNHNATSPEHNPVYLFYNEKQNKDVYMVVLRSEGKLIGYYEKHEFRNKETMKPYDLWQENR